MRPPLLGTMSLLVVIFLGCASVQSDVALGNGAGESEGVAEERFSSWVLEATPSRLERGRYLAHQVANCVACHSQRSWDKFAGPVDQETLGAGSELGYLGLDKVAPNITPSALESWSDAALVQVFTSNRSPDGSAVHEFIPGGGFTKMALEDVYSVVSYTKSLDPIEADPSPRGSQQMEVASPEAHESQLPPDSADEVATGEYLVQLAACRLCHGEDLSGGQEFQIPDRKPIATKNVSDPTSGGGDRGSFVGRFRAFSSDGARRLRSPLPLPSTIMPWTNLGRMTEEDLGAMYEYLVANRPRAEQPVGGE